MQGDAVSVVAQAVNEPPAFGSDVFGSFGLPVLVPGKSMSRPHTHLSDTMYALISFRKSTAPQNC